MRILLVEDEAEMATALSSALRRYDMVVDHAPTLADAEEAIAAKRFYYDVSSCLTVLQTAPDPSLFLAPPVLLCLHLSPYRPRSQGGATMGTTHGEKTSWRGQRTG